MGKVLGNYVHHHWDNYLLAGTYRKEVWNQDENGNIKQQTSDFDASIFKNYARVIRSHAQRFTLNLNKQELKNLEVEINTTRKEKYHALKLLTNRDKQALFELVIKNANIGKDLDAATLAAYIDFDDATEGISLKTQLKTDGVGKLTLLKSGNYSTFQGLKSRFKTAYALIKSIEDKDSQQPLLERTNSLWIDVVQYMKKHNEQVEQEKKVSKGGTKRGAENTKNAIPDHIADFIIRELQDILAISTLSSNLAKLKGSFAEIMGAIAGNKALQVAEDTINTELPKLLKGLESNSVGNLGQAGNFHLSLEYAEPIVADQSKRAEQFKTIIEENDGSGRWFRFKTDYESQNKMDFVFQYQDREIGASMKATDMSKTTGILPNHTGISLQKGTSLYMYLVAMQARQFMPNIGNHFLNVFAQPSSVAGQLRKDANNALALSLLYSALSGAEFKEGPLAEILMIEDTAKKLQDGYSRVRLYSIPVLLQEAMQAWGSLGGDSEIVNIAPAISSIHLSNDYIGEETDNRAERKRNVQARITQILKEARSDQFKFDIYIKKDFLNRIYNNK